MLVAVLKLDYGYKSYLISTIVDEVFSSGVVSGYKSYLISTIVDRASAFSVALGYKSYLISTIVDMDCVLIKNIWL